MDDVEKLKVLLPHWIEHNAEHAEEFREWAIRAGEARQAIEAAARKLEEANRSLKEGLAKIESLSEEEKN